MCYRNSWIIVPLQSLAEKYFDILRFAYKSHRYDGLYDKIVSAFDGAEEHLEQFPLSVILAYQELEEKEEERRRGDTGTPIL